MNSYQNCSSGAGLLKQVYPGKGPVADMHSKHPQIEAVRRRRDLVAKK